MAGTPAGWPAGLAPPGSSEFDARVSSWLFDVCPPRYRDHPVLRRQPRVLAWLAVRHVEAQVRVLAEATAAARAELGAGADRPVGARVLDEVLLALDAESVTLLADLRGVRLVAAALSGVRFVPRL